MDRDYNNYKPYRTKEQKKLAREMAWQDKQGHWHSNAPVSFHSVRKDLLKRQ